MNAWSRRSVSRAEGEEQGGESGLPAVESAAERRFAARFAGFDVGGGFEQGDGNLDVAAAGGYVERGAARDTHRTRRLLRRIATALALWGLRRGTR